MSGSSCNLSQENKYWKCHVLTIVILCFPGRELGGHSMLCVWFVYFYVWPDMVLRVWQSLCKAIFRYTDWIEPHYCNFIVLLFRICTLVYLVNIVLTLSWTFHGCIRRIWQIKFYLRCLIQDVLMSSDASECVYQSDLSSCQGLVDLNLSSVLSQRYLSAMTV